MHGLPSSVVSDRGTLFTFKFRSNLMTLLHIDSKLSSAFHPHTDGQPEQPIQSWNCTYEDSYLTTRMTGHTGPAPHPRPRRQPRPRPPGRSWSYPALEFTCTVVAEAVHWHPQTWGARHQKANVVRTENCPGSTGTSFPWIVTWREYERGPGSVRMRHRYEASFYWTKYGF